MRSWRWTSGHSAMGGYLPTEAGYDGERSVAFYPAAGYREVDRSTKFNPLLAVPPQV